MIVGDVGLAFCLIQATKLPHYYAVIMRETGNLRLHVYFFLLDGREV